MKYQFMKDNSSIYPVEKMARIFKVSKSCYYGWLKRKQGTREQRDKELLAEIKRLFEKNQKRYGSPRIYKELRGGRYASARSKIARFMRQDGLVARPKRRYKVTTDSKHDYPISPNLLNRNFSTDVINKCWVSDITYIDTYEGWLYLCTIIDLYSRRVVGWAMADHLRAELAINALDMAVLHRRPPKGLMFHSDRGIQYAARDFRNRLNKYKMIQSMSRKGNCWDNAPAESFFSSLKMEEVYSHTKYKTREEARLRIFDYIEVFYNRQRRHSLLDYMSPVDYERFNLQMVA